MTSSAAEGGIIAITVRVVPSTLWLCWWPWGASAPWAPWESSPRKSRWIYESHTEKVYHEFPCLRLRVLKKQYYYIYVYRIWWFLKIYSLHPHGQQRDSDHDQIQDVEGVTTEWARVHECSVHCHLSVEHMSVWECMRAKTLNQVAFFLLLFFFEKNWINWFVPLMAENGKNRKKMYM